MEQLRHAKWEVDTCYIERSDGVNDTALSEKVRFTFVGGGEGEILLHLVNHTTYHHDMSQTSSIGSRRSHRRRIFPFSFEMYL
jgi:hypothetical protein